MTQHRAKTIQRQQETLKAAMRIVLEEGPERLTIVRLAKEIGASVGGLYRYFPSKEALIYELQKQAIEHFAEFQGTLLRRLEATLQQASTEVAALARVVAAFCSYPAHQLVAPQRHNLLTTFLAAPKEWLDQEQATSINESVAPLIKVCADRISEGIATTALSPGDGLQRAHVLFAGLQGLDDFRKRDRIQPPNLVVGALLPLMIETFMLGWGAKPEALTEALTHTMPWCLSPDGGAHSDPPPG